jgi:hypothetical protein
MFTRETDLADALLRQPPSYIHSYLSLQRISTLQHYDTMEIIALGAETCVCMFVNDQRKVGLPDPNFLTSRSAIVPQTVLTATLRASWEPCAHWSPRAPRISFGVATLSWRPLQGQPRSDGWKC